MKASPRALLVSLRKPARIWYGEALLEDNASLVLDGRRVWGRVGPWWPMFDLLIDQAAGTVAGVTYGLTKAERPWAWMVCRALDEDVIRYCISHQEAADLLRNPAGDYHKSPLGDVTAGSRAECFPQNLVPVRQVLNEIMSGRRDRSELDPRLLESAARFFDRSAERVEQCSHLVEVTWVQGPLRTPGGLPSWFPSRFKPERTQRFAEDIWYYERASGDDEASAEPVAVGFNLADEILEPHRFPATGLLEVPRLDVAWK